MIVIYIICICIVHKNCIRLHFYPLCHIKEKGVEFLFIIIIFLFCSLVRKENIKRPGFYTRQVIRVFSNFLQLRQLSKTKNACEYYDLLELRYA